MAMADELIIGMMDEMYDDTYPEDTFEAHPVIAYWNSKNDPIKLTDMSINHLRHTIQFLRRQIDGSIHDEFCYQNINAMEQELKRRGQGSSNQNKTKNDRLTTG